MQVAILYERSLLPTDHPDYASEVGVMESVAAVREALAQAGHQVWEVGASKSVAELVAVLERPRPDVVVNLCEGFTGESRHEAHVAGVLELLGLPYTGSPAKCLSLVHNKPQTKRLLMAHRLPTPEFVAFMRSESPRRDVLAGLLNDGPLIVKPVTEDASLGIGPQSVVTHLADALEQIARVQERYGDVMVERYIEGREFNVSILALTELEALPLAEIEFESGEANPWSIVTYESKWSADSAADRATPVRCPAVVDETLAAELREIATSEFRVTACRDYGRVDVRVDTRGKPMILEVNANPDIGPTAGFARALAAAGVKYGEFVERLVQQAARRKSEVGSRKSESVGRAKPLSDTVTLRSFRTEDRAGLVDILRACEMFRPDEIVVADEILGDVIAKGEEAAGYRVVVAEQDGRAIGWSCYGQVPLTDATYDLYWIAVTPTHQQLGVGRQLLAECESYLWGRGARWLLAETSSTAVYDGTRAFYARCGFQIVTSVPDFYRAADGLMTFAKRLDGTGDRNAADAS